MVDARLEGQRVRRGIWAVSDLNSTYEFRMLPIQTDQDSFLTPWLVRTKDSLPPKRARATKAADGTMLKDGFWQFQWSCSLWTFDMAKYWNGTVLNGADSADVTTMTYDKYNEPIYLTCKAYAVDVPDNGQPWPGGYHDIVLPFDYGTVITA